MTNLVHFLTNNIDSVSVLLIVIRRKVTNDCQVRAHTLSRSKTLISVLGMWRPKPNRIMSVTNQLWYVMLTQTPFEPSPHRISLGREAEGLPDHSSVKSILMKTALTTSQTGWSSSRFAAHRLLTDHGQEVQVTA